MMIGTENDKIGQGIGSTARTEANVVDADYCGEAANHAAGTEGVESNSAGGYAVIGSLVVRIALARILAIACDLKRLPKARGGGARLRAILGLFCAVRLHIERCSTMGANYRNALTEAQLGVIVQSGGLRFIGARP
jgi:hypothetical protein